MATEYHMWPYWRDRFHEPVDALEAYYEELLAADTQESQDLRVAVSTIRNARRAPQSTVGDCIIKINNAAIDSILKELDEKHPFVED